MMEFARIEEHEYCINMSWRKSYERHSDLGKGHESCGMIQDFNGYPAMESDPHAELLHGYDVWFMSVQNVVGIIRNIRCISR